VNSGSPVPQQSLGRSFICAASGLFRVLLYERNARIEVCVALLVGAAAAFFRVSGWQLAAVLLCIFGVLSLEILNSAVEAVVDLASPGQHPLAKHAKDAAAGAVLMAALGSVVIGCWVFVPKLIYRRHYLGLMVSGGTDTGYCDINFWICILLLFLAILFLLWISIHALVKKDSDEAR